ncbi:MAG: hypothetical protein ACXVRP_14735 [Solirubrobacteraceae bacterium]
MTSFTHQNLKDLEDSAAARGADIEARLGRKQLNSEHLGVSYLRYGPGYRTPYGHRHATSA